MSDIGLVGLAFFVAALATVTLGVAGLVVQALAVVVLARARRSPRSAWSREVAIVALGPSIAIGLGAVSALLMEAGGLGRDTKEMLDGIAWVVPVAAIALWIGAQVVLARARW